MSTYGRGAIRAVALSALVLGLVVAAAPLASAMGDAAAHDGRCVRHAGDVARSAARTMVRDTVDAPLPSRAGSAGTRSSRERRRATSRSPSRST
jgi:hypothetical protein